MFSTCCISSFVNRIFVVGIFLIFSFPLKTPSCGAEESMQGERVVVTAEQWISSTSQLWGAPARAHLLAATGLCIKCFKFNSTSHVWQPWAYSPKQNMKIIQKLNFRPNENNSSDSELCPMLLSLLVFYFCPFSHFPIPSSPSRSFFQPSINFFPINMSP